MIPSSWWKISAALVGGLAAWGGMIWLGISMLPGEMGLAEVCALPSGTFPVFFSTICLVFAAQLSFLIYWYRSKSRKDFLGLYRLWAWAGAFWAISSVCLGTGLHEPIARLLVEHWPLDCWRPETMYWLAPFAIGFLAISQVLGREMRCLWPSEFCWILMFLLSLTAGAMQLGGELLIPEAIRTPVCAGATTLWHFSIAASLLVHAHYVVHVNNEAPPRRAGLIVRSWRGVRGLIGRVFGLNSTKKTKTKKPAAAKKEAPSAAEKREKPVPARRAVGADGETDGESGRLSWAKRFRKRVLGQTIRLDAPQPQVKAPVSAMKPAAPAPAATPSDFTEAPSPEQNRSQGKRFQDDEDDEYDDLESHYDGLSKRERKKLKKLHRQQDRD